MNAAANRSRIARGVNGAGGQLRPEPRPPGSQRQDVAPAPRSRSQRLSDRRLAEAAARYAQRLGYTLEELRGPSRAQSLMTARVLVTVALRANLGASYPQAGRVLARDHSTLLVALQRRGLA